MFENFALVHEEGKLYARVRIDGQIYAKDVTAEFEKDTALDDWLDYRIGLRHHQLTSNQKGVM